MSTYNIREKFSYLMTTSSIDYIRNYNFNTATVSDIPLVMNNSDDVIPITVNITTTVPWIQIVDPISGVDLKYPAGNVVLNPTSSKVVLVKIDLPPDIENIPESVLYPNISLDVKSGSFGIYTTTGSAQTNKNIIVPSTDIISLSVGQQTEVAITVYDLEGNIDNNPEVVWLSNNMGIAQIIEPTQISSYSPRNVIGVAPGDTNIVVTSGERKVTIPVSVRGITTAGGSTSGAGPVQDNTQG